MYQTIVWYIERRGGIWPPSPAGCLCPSSGLLARPVLWGPLFRTSCFALHDGLSFFGRSLSLPCSGWCLRQASLSSSPRRSVSTRRSLSSSRMILSRSLSRRSLISILLPPLSLRGLGRDL